MSDSTILKQSLNQAASAYLEADRSFLSATDARQAALMSINDVIAEELRASGLNARVITRGYGTNYTISIHIISPDSETSNPLNSVQDSARLLESPDQARPGDPIDPHKMEGHQE